MLSYNPSQEREIQLLQLLRIADDDGVLNERIKSIASLSLRLTGFAINSPKYFACFKKEIPNIDELEIGEEDKKKIQGKIRGDNKTITISKESEDKIKDKLLQKKAILECPDKILKQEIEVIKATLGRYQSIQGNINQINISNDQEFINLKNEIDTKKSAITEGINSNKKKLEKLKAIFEQENVEEYKNHIQRKYPDTGIEEKDLSDQELEDLYNQQNEEVHKQKLEGLKNILKTINLEGTPEIIKGNQEAALLELRGDNFNNTQDAIKNYMQHLNFKIKHQNVSQQYLDAKKQFHELVFNAIEEGDNEFVKLCIEHIDLNYIVADNGKNPDQNTFLHIAAQHNNLEIVQLLLENGANITLENSQNQDAIKCACNPIVKNIIEIQEKIDYHRKPIQIAGFAMNFNGNDDLRKHHSLLDALEKSKKLIEKESTNARNGKVLEHCIRELKKLDLDSLNQAYVAGNFLQADKTFDDLQTAHTDLEADDLGSLVQFFQLFDYNKRSAETDQNQETVQIQNLMQEILAMYQDHQQENQSEDEQLQRVIVGTIETLQGLIARDESIVNQQNLEPTTTYTEQNNGDRDSGYGTPTNGGVNNHPGDDTSASPDSQGTTPINETPINETHAAADKTLNPVKKSYKGIFIGLTIDIAITASVLLPMYFCVPKFKAWTQTTTGLAVVTSVALAVTAISMAIGYIIENFLMSPQSQMVDLGKVNNVASNTPQPGQ